MGAVWDLLLIGSMIGGIGFGLLAIFSGMIAAGVLAVACIAVCLVAFVECGLGIYESECRPVSAGQRGVEMDGAEECEAV